MPKIPEYTAPLEALTESTRGTAAFEQAGRRLAPAYNEAATFEKDQGKITAEAYKQLVWPEDIIKLRAAQETGAKGINIHGGGGGGGGGRGRGAYTPSYDGLGQVSRGAGALGKALADGGYDLADSGDEDVGDITNVTVSPNASKNYNSAEQGLQKYNSWLDAKASDYTTALVNTRDYWTRYNGGNPYATDQSQTSSVGPNPAPEPGKSWFSGLSDWISNGTAPVTSNSYTGE